MRFPLLLGAFCLLAGSCGQHSDSSTASSALRAGEQAPVGQAAPSDFAVYEAMLDDRRAEFQKVYPEDRKSLRYAIDKQTSGSLFKLCVERLKSKLEDRPALYSELVGDLRRRNLSPGGENGKPADLSKLGWKGDNQVAALTGANGGRAMGWSQMKERLPGVVCLFVFDLPGYSRDGKFVAVFTWIGPSHIHSVHEVSLLEFREGQWTVKWRELAYYL